MGLVENLAYAGAVLIYIIVIFGFGGLIALIKVWLLATVNKPEYEAVFCKDNGTGDTETLLSEGGKWQFMATNGENILIKIKTGLFKSIDLEIAKDDYMELPRTNDPGKKIIIIGKKNLNKEAKRQYENLLDEKNELFNKNVDAQIKSEKQSADSDMIFDKVVKQHKELNRAGPIIMKSGGNK
jgi:hypothetical protein